MHKESPKISVIIPICNVERYLYQCIDSVLEQTYENIEVLLVDDGSTDGCGAICDLYSKKDNRVKAIHKENGGAASAREYGMHAMTGEYVMFVDGDDWLDLETVESCLKVVRQYPNVDCVLYSYVKEYIDHASPMHVMDKSMHMEGRGIDARVYRRLFGLTSKELTHPEKMETMGSCCMKLYTAKCAQKGRYFDLKEIGSSEDTLFNMYALYGIKEAVYLDRCFYHYRKRDNTQTSKYRPDLRNQWGKLFRKMEGIIEEKQLGESYTEALSNRIALSITAIALNELSNKASSELSKVREIQSYLSDVNYRKHCLRVSIREMPLAWKIFMICAKLKLSLPIYIMLRLTVILRK